MWSLCPHLLSRGIAIGTEAGKRPYDAPCNRRGTDDAHGQKPGAFVRQEPSKSLKSAEVHTGIGATTWEETNIQVTIRALSKAPR